MNTIPHALHWSKAEHLEGVELCVTVAVRKRAWIGNDELVAKGTDRAIREMLLQLRDEMAETLNCEPNRINFIGQDGVASQVPLDEPHKDA